MSKKKKYVKSETKIIHWEGIQESVEHVYNIYLPKEAEKTLDEFNDWIRWYRKGYKILGARMMALKKMEHKIDSLHSVFKFLYPHWITDDNHKYQTIKRIILKLDGRGEVIEKVLPKFSIRPVHLAPYRTAAVENRVYLCQVHPDEEAEAGFCAVCKKKIRKLHKQGLLSKLTRDELLGILSLL